MQSQVLLTYATIFGVYFALSDTLSEAPNCACTLELFVVDIRLGNF